MTQEIQNLKELLKSQEQKEKEKEKERLRWTDRQRHQELYFNHE